jgi:hypothetical protein
MDGPGKPIDLLVKFGSAMFAAIIAPIAVGIGTWFIQKKFDDPPKPDAPPSPVAEASAAPGTPAKGEPKPDAKDASKPASSTAPTTAPTVAATPSPRVPFQKKKKAAAVVRLFNGIDLTGFHSFLGVPEGGKAPYGHNNDPEHVFSVRAGELHVSGKVFGGLVTNREHENYHLTVEYRWGEKRWPPRADLPRLSGIVLHATGPPGALHGWSMAGVTCLISELDTGALSLPELLPKAISLSAEAERLVLKNDRTLIVYKPGEPLTTLKGGLLHRLGYRPRPGLRAAQGKTSPGKAGREPSSGLGEWNTLECLCAGDRITVIHNGTTVNVATKVSQTRGKIFIESQGAEIYFRKIELKELSGTGSIALRDGASRTD